MTATRLSLLLVICGLRLAAADFCALRVTVVGAAGDSLETPVALLDADGKIVEATVSRGGHAEFCDFGFGFHTVRVQNLGCGFITRDQVILVPGVTRNVKVTLDCPPQDEPWVTGAFPIACSLYLRVASESGEKLSDAKAKVSGRPQPFYADSYGRIFARIPQKTDGATTEVVVSAPGYLNETVGLPCKAALEIQRVVTLRRVP